MESVILQPTFSYYYCLNVNEVNLDQYLCISFKIVEINITLCSRVETRKFARKLCPHLNEPNQVIFMIITHINIKMSADSRPDKELTNALS